MKLYDPNASVEQLESRQKSIDAWLSTFGFYFIYLTWFIIAKDHIAPSGDIFDKLMAGTIGMALLLLSTFKCISTLNYVMVKHSPQIKTIKYRLYFGVPFLLYIILLSFGIQIIY